MPRLHLFAEGRTELFFAPRGLQPGRTWAERTHAALLRRTVVGLSTAPSGTVQLRPSPYYLDEDAQNMQM